mgnify:CR=1 FL=1
MRSMRPSRAAMIISCCAGIRQSSGCDEPVRYFDAAECASAVSHSCRVQFEGSWPNIRQVDKSLTKNHGSAYPKEAKPEFEKGGEMVDLKVKTLDGADGSLSETVIEEFRMGLSGSVV